MTKIGKKYNLKKKFENFQKVVKKLSKICKKICKKKILKRVGGKEEEGREEEEGDL
jgi:hypothetical protein